MERDSAVEIIDEPKGIRMAVRNHLQNEVSSLAAVPEVHKGAMMTLAFIAYKQPVKQSDVIKYRNTKAYDHIALLEEKGFIRREKQKVSYILYTTKKFHDYFGDIRSQTRQETAKKFAEHAEEFDDPRAAEGNEENEIVKEAEILEKVDEAKENLIPEDAQSTENENPQNKNEEAQA